MILNVHVHWTICICGGPNGPIQCKNRLQQSKRSQFN